MLMVLEVLCLEQEREGEEIIIMSIICTHLCIKSQTISHCN